MKVTKLRLFALLAAVLLANTMRADDPPPDAPPPPGPYYTWVPGIGWIGPDNPGGGDTSDSDR